MSENLEHLRFLLEKRNVGTDFHLMQVKKWLAFDGGRNLDNVLVYAAFELRCAIERLAFEILFIAKDMELTPEEEDRCKSIKGTLELLGEVEPNYRKRAQFTNLASLLHPQMPRIAIIDIKFIKRKWHEISDYCHHHFRPAETWGSSSREFQINGFKLLKETYDQIMKWLLNGKLGVVDKSSMEPEVREVYQKFLADEIDEEQVKLRLKIAEPVLESRMRAKK
ncbi:MAG TPA: hypothetical protein VI546_02195 [candidate division Zixibacteria bacterium]|nr:hypothetical protein [candidate division Zixibacteria bacterium]